jgi:hypothetical protein
MSGSGPDGSEPDSQRRVPLTLRLAEDVFRRTNFMKTTLAVVLVPVFALVLPSATAAQEHTVTSLGYPSSRFAWALQKPDDLRLLVRGERTRTDVAAILEQVGWRGRLEDLDRPAAAAEITVSAALDSTYQLWGGVRFRPNHWRWTAAALRAPEKAVDV